MNGDAAVDPELDAVAAELVQLDPGGLIIAAVIRNTFDQLYDGQNSGRYRWDQLFKTEKTHCGTLVEINLQRALKFQDGEKLDFRIAGFEVDCKYSQSPTGWMIPPEAHGHLCMLLWADDARAPIWSLGVVRANSECLNAGQNRDGKRTLNEMGRASIKWLWNKEPFPGNILLQMKREDVDRIMEIAEKSGTKAVNELFRLALKRRVGRAAIATVGRQLDFMRRVRANGGSRTPLQEEGIVILGQYPVHAKLAAILGVETPGPSESVAVRLAKADLIGPGVAEIDGSLWRLATPDDPPVKAPVLPSTRKNK